MRSVILVLASALLVGAGCEWTRSGSKAASDSKTPELVVHKGAIPKAILAPDKEKPLLLEDEPETKAGDAGVADNSRCQVCHINFMKEELTEVHAKAGIGCSNCHGPSDAHIADESWASGGNGTAPDIMYTRQKINPFCVECHTRAKIGEIEMHKELFDVPEGKRTCVECHGKHLMAQRKCKWK
jgi:hypothetical protein